MAHYNIVLLTYLLTYCICLFVCPVLTRERVGRLSQNFQGSSRVPWRKFSVQKFWGHWVRKVTLCFHRHRRRPAGRTMGSPSTQPWAALATGWRDSGYTL